MSIVGPARLTATGISSSEVRLAWRAAIFDDPSPAYIGGYEVFQFCLGNGPAESVEFAVYESDLGEGGFETSTLYGPDTGRKRWKIGFPVMSGASADLKVTASNGQRMTAADYVWDLYSRSRVSGRPFVIRSPRNNQFYLVKFANPNLDYTRGLTQLFATQLELKQMRLPLVSVFDPLRLAKPPFGWYSPSHLGVDRSGSSNDLTIVGGVTAGGDTQNGLATMRLDGTSGYLEFGSAMSLAEALIVVKYRGASFANNAGLLTDDAGSWLGLVGTSGGTAFANQSFGSVFTYRQGGVVYAETDEEAPVNYFALIHARWETPVSLANLRIGTKGGTAGTFGAWDIGDIFLFDQVNTQTDILELAESIATSWDL